MDPSGLGYWEYLTLSIVADSGGPKPTKWWVNAHKSVYGAKKFTHESKDELSYRPNTAALLGYWGSVGWELVSHEVERRVVYNKGEPQYSEAIDRLFYFKRWIDADA